MMTRLFEEKRFLRGTLYVDFETDQGYRQFTFEFGKMGGPISQAVLQRTQLTGACEKLSRALEDDDMLDASPHLGGTPIAKWALGPIVECLSTMKLVVERDEMAEQVKIDIRKIAELEAKLVCTQELERKISNLQAEREAWLGEKKELKTLIDQLSNDNKQLQEAHSKEIAALETVLGIEENNHEVWQETAFRHEDRIRKLSAHMGDLERREDMARKALKEKEAQISSLTKELQEARQKGECFRNKYMQLSGAASAAADNIAEEISNLVNGYLS